jgi:hypothetical protein
LLAVASAAVARRFFLRSGFGVDVPLHFAAAPVAAAAADLGVALIVLAMPIDHLAMRLGLAGLLGFATYLAVLKAALWATGQSLSLTHFVVEAPHS